MPIILGMKPLTVSPSVHVLIPFHSPAHKYLALHYTTWCCDRHAGSDFQLTQFFEGHFLYRDSQAGDLYYGAPNEQDRVKILPPPKEKRKAQDKPCPPDERKSLVSQLVAWRRDAHATDYLAGV